MGGVRKAAVAGTWYPGDPAELMSAVDACLADVREDAGAVPRALVVPHAGLRYSGPVAAHAYAAVRGAPLRAVVLVGPSHFVPFRGVSIWPDGAWQTPLGMLPVAAALAAAIATRSSMAVMRPDAHGREHSLEMQLPFLARLAPEVPIVPIVLGDQSRATCDDLAAALAGGIAAETGAAREVLLIASSDLSHYEPARRAWQLDRVVVESVNRFDVSGLMAALEREPRHACGGGAIVAVLEAARRLGAARARVLHYADSGDVSGDKSAVVGYLSAGVW